MGFVPFASSFAMFAAGRAFEQIRNTVGYPHLNVKIGATHGGISVGEDGASHQCNEDFAAHAHHPRHGSHVPLRRRGGQGRRARPPPSMRAPSIMRFGRSGGPGVPRASDYQFEIGKGEVLRDGTDVAIIATGLMVDEAIEAAKALKAKGINARVINMCTIKPLDEDLVTAGRQGDAARSSPCEEHTIIGGLGEAVLLPAWQSIALCPCKRIGVNDEFGHSGPAGDLLKQFGLCADHIAEVTEAFCK